MLNKNHIEISRLGVVAIFPAYTGLYCYRFFALGASGANALPK